MSAGSTSLGAGVNAPFASAPFASERAAVLAALKNAAAVTGSDFHYLLGTAMRESSLRPQARSATSSATGLFQFVEQTWLGLVKAHGARYGLGAYAGAIQRGADGRWRCDAGVRDSILALRKDPRTSALMAGEFAKDTGNQLRAELGRDVCGGELYAAHFLGTGAACRLIRLNGSNPAASAAGQFPEAAAANRGVFFHPDGSPKSIRDVYAWAMRQPGAEGTVRVASLSDITPAQAPAPARVEVAGAHDAEMQMLMLSLLNWQPHGTGSGFGFGLGGGFDALSRLGGAAGGGTGGAGSLSFGPGLLGLLSDARARSES